MSDDNHYPTRCIRVLKGHTGNVNCIRYTHDGKYCMSAGQDRSVCLWNPNRDDVKDGFLINRYKGPHSYGVNEIAIASDNSEFASCGEEREVLVWDVSTSHVKRRLYGHNQRINTVAYNEESTLVVSGSYDATVKIYDLKSHNNAAIQTLSEGKDSISQVIFTKNAIISSSIDGHIRTYDIRAGQLRDDVLSVPITHLSLSFDEKCLYASTLNNQSILIEREMGTILNRYKDHKSTNYKVEGYINNTDDYIYSGSEDGQIIIYDLVDAKPIHTLTYHNNAVTSLSIHPKRESTQLLAASLDSTISVWE
ncbi:hypothetical protein WA158_007164 [Blastocystis sp. Blastoise]